MTGSHLGNFLRSVRTKRGYSNINKYVRDYQLPISYVYYREIETGKRRIALESALSLCKALQVSHEVFYYHLLKDVLPSPVKEEYLSLIPKHHLMDQGEPDDAEKTPKTPHLKLYSDQLKKRTIITTAEMDKYFVEHPERWLFTKCLNCVPQTTISSAKSLAKRLQISDSVESILDDLRKFGLFKVETGKRGTEKIITRIYDRITSHESQLFTQGILSETERTLEQLRTGYSPTDNDPQVYCGVVNLTEDRLQDILGQLSQLIFELTASHDADHPQSELCNLGILAMPAERYKLGN